MKAHITINSPHLHIIFYPMQKKIQSDSLCSVLPLLFTLACDHNLHSTLPNERQHEICKKKGCNNNKNNNTPHSKTGNEDDFWLLLIGAVHFGLIRQWGRRGTSILPDMKYGGNIFCLLSEDPDSLMIQQVMSDKHTHTHTDTNMEYKTPHPPLYYCCQIQNTEQQLWHFS